MTKISAPSTCLPFSRQSELPPVPFGDTSPTSWPSYEAPPLLGIHPIQSPSVIRRLFLTRAAIHNSLKTPTRWANVVCAVVLTAKGGKSKVSGFLGIWFLLSAFYDFTPYLYVPCTSFVPTCLIRGSGGFVSVATSSAFWPFVWLFGFVISPDIMTPGRWRRSPGTLSICLTTSVGTDIENSTTPYLNVSYPVHARSNLMVYLDSPYTTSC